MKREPKRILFVCVANSCRSQMAEAIARAIGGDHVDAWSAGSHPSGSIHPSAAASLTRRGLSLDGHRSKGIDDLPAFRWDALVTMGCGDACPHVPAERRVDWQIPDPTGLAPRAFDAIRDDIESRIRGLIASLE